MIQTSLQSERPAARRAYAFTLIELLVVISIIALMVAILLPALTKAREQAKQIKCLSNTRQIVIGLASYAMDNDGLYPALFGGWSQRSWGSYATATSGNLIGPGLLQTQGYINSWEVFYCPSRSDTAWPGVRVLDRSTYVTVNGYEVPNATCYNYRGWLEPPRGNGAHDWSEPTVARMAVTADLVINADIALEAHETGTNVGYSDGSGQHVNFDNEFTPWAGSGSSYLDAVITWAGSGNLTDTQHHTIFTFFDTE